MNPNSLNNIPHEIRATSFKQLQKKIIRFTQSTGLKINRWQIQKEGNIYHFFYESAIDDYEIQKEQLRIEEVTE